MWPVFIALALDGKINAHLFLFNKGLCGGHVDVKLSQCLLE